ncbi:hypothetical protein [Streptomyces clavifer]|uniref:hypothetical protein n=1 Tax=Streptomyces clavifer TaxID=68188 RepID=UPI0034D75813
MKSSTCLKVFNQVKQELITTLQAMITISKVRNYIMHIMKGFGKKHSEEETKTTSIHLSF